MVAARTRAHRPSREDSNRSTEPGPFAGGGNWFEKARGIVRPPMHDGDSRKGNAVLHLETPDDPDAEPTDEERDLIRRLARLLADVALNDEPADDAEIAS
jgi:hypothetical protein